MTGEDDAGPACDGLRLLVSAEAERRLKLDGLRAAIAQGLSGGSAEPLDMERIKREARRPAHRRVE